MRKKRQAYTKEFKQEAVRLVQAGDRSAIEVAASLNVDQSLLSKWVKSSELEGAGRRNVLWLYTLERTQE